jgi:hypothetical protein
VDVGADRAGQPVNLIPPPPRWRWPH